MRIKNPWSRRRGSTTVEFALTLPVLVVMGLGVTELGQQLTERQRFVQATYETARYAAQGADTVSDSDVAARANQVVETMGMNTTGLVCSVDRGWDGEEPIVTVRLTLPVRIMAQVITLPEYHVQEFTLVERGF